MSTSESGRSGGAATLDELIALNDEMAALVRAGVPLERGLVAAGAELRGRLGSMARDLGGRLGEGDRLPEALGKAGHGLPALYGAVVEAGLRSGRLATALEGMAAIARGRAEARQAIGAAMLYPLVVLSLAASLATGFVLGIVPRFVAAFDSLGLPPSGLMSVLARTGGWVPYWGPVVPVILLLVALFWLRSGRSTSLDAGRFGRWAVRLPLVGRVVRGYRDAGFADLLALLVEHRVPLDEAVRLAAGASGDPKLRRSADALAESLRRGDAGQAEAARSLPPLLAWIVTAGRNQGDLATALRSAGASYRRKAEARAELLRAILPTVLLLGIGAVAVLLYGLLLFLPLTRLYDELAIPIS